MDELDAATLAAYRRALDDAVEAVAEHPTASRMQAARGAVEHIFAAIERRQARERAAMEIVRAVARFAPEGIMRGEEDGSTDELHCLMCSIQTYGDIPSEAEHDPDCKWRQARALLASPNTPPEQAD